jgi:hypothetical protein
MSITIKAAMRGAVLVAGLMTGAAVQAVTVPGVYSTGFGAGGASLAAGNGVADANYRLTATTSATQPVGTQAVTFYNFNYAADTATSRWISYTADTSQMGYNANFTFTTTFDLTGFNAATARLSGFVGADNEATVLLNGVAIGGVYGYRRETFTSLTAFSTLDPALFVSGVNRLDVVLHNIDLIAAVRIDQLTLTADAGAVPEPTTWAMMVLGFGTIGGAMRRRQTMRLANA